MGRALFLALGRWRQRQPDLYSEVQTSQRYLVRLSFHNNISNNTERNKPAGKGISRKAYWPEFGFWKPHGRRREPIPLSYFLMSTWVCVAEGTHKINSTKSRRIKLDLLFLWKWCKFFFINKEPGMVAWTCKPSTRWGMMVSLRLPWATYWDSVSVIKQ